MAYTPVAPHDVYDASCQAWDAQSAGSAARLLAAVDAAYLAGRKRAAADIRAEAATFCMDGIGRHLVDTCAEIAERTEAP